MKSTVCQVLRMTAVAGIVSFGYSLTGCVAPKYAPAYSEVPLVGASPAYANGAVPAQPPGSSSKTNLIEKAERQQALIRAERNRISELENHPQESPDHPDSIPSRDELVQLPTATLEKIVRRQQALIDTLKRRVRELEKKT